MTEFLNLTLAEQIQPTDQLLLVRDTEALRVNAANLLQGNGNSGTGVNTSTSPPALVEYLFWNQVDEQGQLIETWQRSRDGAHWVSQRAWTVGYFKDSGPLNFYKAGCPVTGSHVWFDSLYVSALSRGNFDSADQRLISIILVDETPAEDVFANYIFEGLGDEERVSEFMPLNIIKPQSDLVAIWMKGKKVKSPPAVQFVQVSLTLRKVYATTA